jgi:hypothetical protein
MWQVAVDSKEWVILDTLLEKLLMLTCACAINEVFLPDACEAESSCDCVYPIAESSQVVTRQEVLKHGGLVVDVSLELDFATTARLLQKNSEAEVTVSRQLGGVEQSGEELCSIAREAHAMSSTRKSR